MPTPKKKRSYTIFYNDGTYMTFELTKTDFEQIEDCLIRLKEETYTSTSIGIIGLSNIKAVILQKEEEQEEEKPETELPPLDQESYNWIKQMGIGTEGYK